jgi:hypothetical protein
MWTVDSPVYFTLPSRILDGSGDPVTTLVTGDFAIDLSDPAGVDREALVTLAHQAGAPGLYGGTFTPDAAGIWRLSIRHDDYGLEATQQFEVGVGGAGYTGGTLTDVTAVRLYMGARSLVYTDDQVQAALDAACAMVETYCNRIFAADDYTHTLDGRGTDMLWLPQYPINDVTTLTIDDEEIDAADYTVEDQSIYYEDGFTKGRRNVVVEYNAGYATIPADLHHAVTALTADLLGTSGRDTTLQSERLGDYQYTTAGGAANPAAGLLSPYASVLAKYRRMVL